MSEQEKDLVVKIAKCVFVKSMNSTDEIVEYNTVSKEMSLPIQIIKAVASKVCKCLMMSQRIEDTDMDDYGFNIMFKNKRKCKA